MAGRVTPSSFFPISSAFFLFPTPAISPLPAVTVPGDHTSQLDMSTSDRCRVPLWWVFVVNVAAAEIYPKTCIIIIRNAKCLPHSRKKNNEISHMKLSNYLPHTSFFHWLADVVAGRRKPIRGKI